MRGIWHLELLRAERRYRADSNQHKSARQRVARKRKQASLPEQKRRR